MGEDVCQLGLVEMVLIEGGGGSLQRKQSRKGKAHQSDDLHEAPKGEEDSKKHLDACIAAMRQWQMSTAVGNELNATME